ncbi:hypothetical protein [Sphingomonas japonica]|uniref:Secreted protein n=1 Tax=Sphingomonas japonica TaxID=511662 RepID=A0ABX0TZH8_9SPHN|nr:hypothetical protein [Sphingomonas japonica]NIJ22866.1 hypothetical protein [Sphingomonas japonica]
MTARRLQLGLIGIAATLAVSGTAMPKSPHALSLDVSRRAGQVVITLTGRSAQRLAVHYTIDVSGRSTTRHAGRSAVGPESQTLSVVRFADQAPWQVRFDATEGDDRPYTIRCTSDDGACTED